MSVEIKLVLDDDDGFEEDGLEPPQDPPEDLELLLLLLELLLLLPFAIESFVIKTKDKKQMRNTLNRFIFFSF